MYIFVKIKHTKHFKEFNSLLLYSATYIFQKLHFKTKVQYYAERQQSVLFTTILVMQRKNMKRCWKGKLSKKVLSE